MQCSKTRPVWLSRWLCAGQQGAGVLSEENQGPEKQTNPPPSYLSSGDKGVSCSKKKKKKRLKLTPSKISIYIYWPQQFCMLVLINVIVGECLVVKLGFHPALWWWRIHLHVAFEYRAPGIPQAKTVP